MTLVYSPSAACFLYTGFLISIKIYGMKENQLLQMANESCTFQQKHNGVVVYPGKAAAMRLNMEATAKW